MSLKGYKQTEEHKRKRAEANSISLLGQRHSPETEFKKGQAPHNKGVRGENSPNWKGGRKASSRRSYEKNKPRYYNNVLKRRAMLKGSGGSHSIVQWETLKAQYNWTCPCFIKKNPLSN